MMHRIIPLMMAVVLGASAASPAVAAEDSQIWTAGSVSLPINDKWKLSEEVVARFSDNRGGLYELELTTLLNVKIVKDVTFAAGYVHNPQYADGDHTVTEHRAREQVTFDNVAKIGAGKLSARMRMEQRWRENGDGTGWRARPYVKFSLPIQGKTSLTVSNETFVNLNTTNFQRQNGLDRMRNFIGINTPIAKSLSVEFGYLNQYGFVRNGDDTVDHVASIAASFSF
jgi:hypothetical protein